MYLQKSNIVHICNVNRCPSKDLKTCIYIKLTYTVSQKKKKKKNAVLVAYFAIKNIKNIFLHVRKRDVTEIQML